MAGVKTRFRKKIPAAQNNDQRNRCNTMEQHWRLFRKDPEYRWRLSLSEHEISEWVENYHDDGLPIAIIRIPVVVHVIYNTPAQNISDSQINSQIVALNADFRRLNLDARSTPEPFRSVAADARIEFALAVRDPLCNTTTGITRTRTQVTIWDSSSNGMKAIATGGHDPWDVTKYLNIWVVNYDNYLGTGTFPFQPSNIQGIVCHYQAFGTIGDLLSRAALGRTATHEIGHYFNLRHIWGSGQSCNDSDLVDDTPNQFTESPSFPPCRTFPSISCSNDPYGDMFMNFMDYSPDQCMNLFTYGQVIRMHATLYATRASLLSSDGLIPVSTGLIPDLWMKDTLDDIGAEPNSSNQPMYISDDIWVRNTNDGLTNHEHQNPIFRPPGMAPNYIYVRVRNRACSGTLSGILKLYWAKASPSLSWPTPWDGSITTPVIMGGSIGSQPISVLARDDDIAIFSWMPPNPLDYTTFGADRSHFCLLARIETSSNPPYGMTFQETADLYSNVQNNNNIVWKNISIIEDSPGAMQFTSIIIANFTNKMQPTSFTFYTPKPDKPSIFEWGQVFVELPPKMLKKLSEEIDESTGIYKVDDKTFRITKSEANLGSFKLAPNELHVFHIYLVPQNKIHLGVHNFTIDIVQKFNNKIVGGQRLLLKNPPNSKYIGTTKTKSYFKMEKSSGCETYT